MCIACIVRGVLPLAALVPVVAGAAEVRSDAPASVSVTVYRSPDGQRHFDLNALAGFALITETRRVTLPAGESTLRFEGVAGGIEAESAIVTGFADGVIEKNRDARLLSPSALLNASLHRGVQMKRTNPRTGVVERVSGTLESDADGGVVFKSAAGTEALRCSGLPETLSFEPFAGTNATPTLSVRVKSEAPITRTVTLSYLASGFDWSATYTATLSADGTKMNLGAWVTLANGNGESFSNAQTQLVAGNLNRESRDPESDDRGHAIIAQCWPRGSTSDATAMPVAAPRPEEFAPIMLMRSLAAPAADALRDVLVTGAKKVQQEQLGDLKLYRVPERTTVAARQMKQVRLMDQYAVPVQQFYSVDVESYVSNVGGTANYDQNDVSPVTRKFRTRNTRANHLGLPLPSGGVALFMNQKNTPLLLSENELKDHAVDQELELEAGTSSDLQVTAVTETRAVDQAGARVVPLLPGVSLRSVRQLNTRRIEISNAGLTDAVMELHLLLDEDARVIRADHALETRDGRPMFSVSVPAQGSITVRYAAAKTLVSAVRP